MALVRCPECGKEISNQAKACIHCGYPLDLISTKAENKEVLLVSSGKASFAALIVFFVLFENIIAGIMIAVILSFNTGAIIFGTIFCSTFEVLETIAFVNGIITTARLRRSIGRRLEYDNSNNNLNFIDIYGRNRAIPIQNIIKFDGPTTLRISYFDLSHRKRVATFGLTNKSKVLQLRSRIATIRYELRKGNKETL